MIRHLDTMRGRAFVLILALLVVSNATALWLYGGRHDDAMDALHDVMVAEQAAVVFQLMDRLPHDQRQAVAGALSGAFLQVLVGNVQRPMSVRLSEPRSDRIGEITNALLGRTQHDRIRVALTTGPDVGASPTRGTTSGEDSLTKAAISHAALANVHLQGRVEASAALTDGTKLTVASRLMSVPHFSWSQLLPSLIALTLSALAIAFLVLGRMTAPLQLLENAAHRLSTNINAPPLTVSGPFEVRSATGAFNSLQARIKELIADRTATAAAIAHDLGTPVTRMRLRAFDITDNELREKLISDLDQMQRMVSGALDFTRLDFEHETAKKVDLLSMVESISEDLTDLGEIVAIQPGPSITLVTKPVLLRRALTNLMKNAATYGKAADIRISDKGKAVEITVFDDGPGLSDAEWNEASQPFRRLGRADATQGTGLGLTIARRIIENLGGTLSKSTGPNHRFGVRVTLPKSTQTPTGTSP
ncbi:MAG: ATP-binding protein [Filomicrobium sp.]